LRAQFKAFGYVSYMRLYKFITVLSLMLCSAVAHAQVYELGDNGALNVREGGGAVMWRDARAAPLFAPKPRLLDYATTPRTFDEALKLSAARHALSPALLEAVVWQESRWHSNALSPKGAVGLTQLMPATALALGVDAHDPVANLDGGARYLRMLLDHFGGDLVKTLAAYNAGVARVERAGGIPAIRETQNYVAAIMARLDSQIRKP
jgi:soluble lytic murein transglycosylase-like protein